MITFFITLGFFHIYCIYIKTTAKIAPDWINTSKNFKNSVCGRFNNLEVIIKWAVEEIGKKKDIKNRPLISPNSASPLNPYIANSWLFEGLDKKKKI